MADVFVSHAHNHRIWTPDWLDALSHRLYYKEFAH